MDADCLRNGSLFCRFAGKSKHKNEKWINYRLLWQMRDPNRRRRGAGSAERTRILVPAEQGNRVRIPDTERSQPIGFAGSESGQRAIRAGPGGRLPKVAVFLKHCFPYGVIRARWKPVIGRAVMARREGWSNAFARKRGRGLRDCKASRAWMDQSEDLQKAKPENCEHHSRKLRC